MFKVQKWKPRGVDRFTRLAVSPEPELQPEG